MKALTYEILKYGLDTQEDTFYQKHHSVIFEDEILEMFQQFNNFSGGMKSFKPFRERAETVKQQRNILDTRFA